MSPGHLGVAGWSVPKSHQEYFSSEGSHLERFSRTFDCVEINSSFYREHQAKTYERWALAVPRWFRFSVKLSREFTQYDRLHSQAEALQASVGNLLALGDKLAVILVQLPPSLEFETKVVRSFFTKLRKACESASKVRLAIEPRHPSWSSPSALRFYADFEVTKVQADPERVPVESEEDEREATSAGGFAYLRFHGSPEIYKSRYEPEKIRELAARMSAWAASGVEPWCIFDNTTFGHAIANASELQSLLGNRGDRPRMPRSNPFPLNRPG